MSCRHPRQHHKAMVQVIVVHIRDERITLPKIAMAATSVVDALACSQKGQKDRWAKKEIATFLHTV